MKLNLSSEGRRDIQFLVLLLFLILLLYFIPSFFIFGKGGLAKPEIFQAFNLYLPYGIAGLFVIVLVYIIHKIIKQKDEVYGNSLSFVSGGEFPALEWKIFKNLVGVYLFFLILFLILGLVAQSVFNQEQSFFGIGDLSQEFSPVDDVIYSFSQISVAENLGAHAFFALFVAFLLIYARRINMGKTSYRMIYWIGGVLAFMVFGIINHTVRYGLASGDIGQVAIIWGLGGLITVASGVFLSFLALHQANNLIFKIKEGFSSDVLITNMVILIIILIVMYSLLFLRKKVLNPDLRGKKK